MENKEARRWTAGRLKVNIPGISKEFVFDGQTLYCLAFMLFVFQTFLERMYLGSTLFDISISKIRLYFRAAAFIVLMAKLILYQRAKITQWALALVMVILGYVTWQTTYMDVIFWMALFIACGKDVKVQNLAKCAFVEYTVGFIGTVSLTLAGLIENATLNRSDGTLRYAMGFKHPNTFGLMVFTICLSYCAIRYGKKPKSEIAVCAAGAAACFLVANSRTFTILLIMLAVMLILFFYVTREQQRLLLKILMIAGAAGVVAVSFYFMVFYTGADPLVAKLNSILSSRLSLSNIYYEGLPMTLFGQDTGTSIAFESGLRTSYFMMDNAYCHLVIRYGVFAAVMVLAWIAAVYSDSVINRRWGICLLGITLFMVLGVSENMTIKFEYNYFMIAAAGILYGTAYEE